METHNEQETVYAQNSQEVDGTQKVIAIIGYLCPLLFFIPLVMNNMKSPFSMFHANQHVILLIAGVVLMLVNIVPLLGQIIWIVGSLVLFVFSIMGIIASASGKLKAMPLIGGFKIL